MNDRADTRSPGPIVSLSLAQVPNWEALAPVLNAELRTPEQAGPDGEVYMVLPDGRELTGAALVFIIPDRLDTRREIPAAPGVDECADATDRFLRQRYVAGVKTLPGGAGVEISGLDGGERPTGG